MNLNKQQLRTLTAAAIVLVLYCILAFVIPFPRGAVFWLSFVFTLLAIFAQLYVLKISFADGKSARSKFYGFPIARIGLFYLIAQLIAGFVCMALGAILPVWVAVLIFVVILGAAALGLIAADAIREEVERQDTVLKKNVETMRALQSLGAGLVGQCEDKALSDDLQKLSDALRFSDPVSSDSTAETEAELGKLLDELQRALLDGDTAGVSGLCRRAQTVLAERNRICKLNKAQ